jgi:hypothetical protein
VDGKPYGFSMGKLFQRVELDNPNAVIQTSNFDFKDDSERTFSRGAWDVRTPPESGQDSSATSSSSLTSRGSDDKHHSRRGSSWRNKMTLTPKELVCVCCFSPSIILFVDTGLCECHVCGVGGGLLICCCMFILFLNLTCLFFLVLQDLEKKKTFFCSELVAAAQQAVSRVMTLLNILTQFQVTFHTIHIFIGWFYQSSLQRKRLLARILRSGRRGG